ncbi:uncharacterized protein LOC135700130 [Ochlerotatus camptorhynchus]|uniref:uncharacterized protein LOC135700130 n=1 Tax=Ochlerotatus camptorhynchus TaxID=644619 RepID=UPI0031DE3A19
MPNGPWKKLAVDFMEIPGGYHLLVATDYYSRQNIIKNTSKLNAVRFYAENMLSFWRMYDADLVGSSLEEIIEHGKEIGWTFTNEDCMLAEEVTRDQSSDPLWYKLRFGRITASCFGRSVKTRINSPSMTLIKYICEGNTSQEFPATLYGKRNEHKVIAAAVELFKFQQHQDFCSRKSGLIVNPIYPYFAAFPDHIFQCSCCGTVVVEAKCPFKFENFNREDGIRSLITRQKPYIIRDMDRSIKMNHKHEYYFQVQMKIHLSKASYAFFVIWAPKFTLFIKVRKHEIFWKINSEKASKFF